MDYVELHCHSAFSFLDGASLPEELVAAAVERGHEALALTDHDSLSGAMEFAQAAKALGLRARPRGGGDRRRRAARQRPRACSRPGADAGRGGGRGRPAPHAARARRARVAQPLPAADPGPRAHARPAQPPRPRPPARHDRRRRRPRRGARLPDGLRAPRGARRADAAPAAARLRPRRACASSCSGRSPRHDRALQPRAGRRWPAGWACRAWRRATSTPTRPSARGCRTPSWPSASTRRSTRPSRCAAATTATCWRRPAAMAARFADHPDAVAETARLADGADAST